MNKKKITHGLRESRIKESHSQEYIDSQGILGEIGARYTLDDLFAIYKDGIRHEDPVISEYANFPKWLADTEPWLDEVEDECYRIKNL